MIKKYFALSIIAASVAIAGCSSDDDNDDDVDTGTNTGSEVVLATPGVGGTAFDTIVNSEAHATLRAAIEQAGLDNTLDDPANTFTIFAPTDAAFTALDNDGDDTTLTTAELLEPANSAALTRVLQYHVLAGDIASNTIADLIAGAGDQTAVANTILVEDGVAQTLSFTLSDSANTGVAVNGVNIDAVDLQPDSEELQGRVHVISSVLLPPAAAVVVDPDPVDPDPVDPDPVDPGPSTGGAVQTALESSGNYTSFLAAFAPDFGLAKLETDASDADPWTVIALPDAAVTGTLALGSYIQTGGGLSPAELLAAGTWSPFGGGSFAVGGTADALTIGGFAVTPVEGGSGGTVTYTISGAL